MKKRKDGYYMIQETVEEDGKKVRKTFYGKTRAAAQEKRDAYHRQQNPDEITFGDVLADYLKQEENRIAAAEYKTKKARLDGFESLKKKKLASITPKDIAVNINILAVKNPSTGKPSAKRTLTRYLQAVSNVFEYAEANRLTTYNPCKYVKIPNTAQISQREALSKAEYQLILNNEDETLLAAKIMLLCGLRRGEACALTWADVDFDNNTVNINKAYDFKARSIKAPKTSAGNRVVPLPLKLKTLLQGKFDGKNLNSPIINNEGKMLTEPQWATLEKKSAKIAGVSFTWHQLRHTYATILYDANVDVLTAQKYLGHSDIKVTLGIYTHLSEEKEQLSASALDNFLG